MMIGGQIKITLVSDEVLLVKPLPIDFVMLERHFKIRFAAEVAAPAVEHMAFLAWSPLKRQERVALGFEDWLPQLAEIDILSEPLAPTLPAP
jgi:hypothetical protein